MARYRALPVAAVIACLGPALRAQGNQPPPVRQIGPILAVTRDSLASVTAAVQVAAARVYVNDIVAHRVLMYDSTLDSMRVIVDSGGGAANAYGTMAGTLLAFHRDSALLVTPSALSMLVLSPAGTIARVMAMPPSGSRGLPSLIGSIFGTPGFDASGRLVYFSLAQMTFRPPPTDGAGAMSLDPPDSAFIVRFNFENRTLDTAGAIRIPRTHSAVDTDAEGRMHIEVTALPSSTVDDWAVTSDGRIAIVRGRDYHVDWCGGGSAVRGTARLPFAWEHLDDSQKTALIDSAAIAVQAAFDSMQTRLQRANASSGSGGVIVESRQSGPPGAPGGTMTVIIAPPPSSEALPASGRESRGPGPVSVTMSVPTVVKATLADVSDYRPPFSQGALRADAEGRLWIRTSAMVDQRPVYDVIDGRGVLIDRVQLPAHRTVAGFGPGVIYMAVRDSSGTAHVERARIR